MLAVDAALVIAGLAFVLGIALLVLLILAPWKSVRDEPPLDDDIETRLLLGEDPEKVAADADAADRARVRRAPVYDLEREADADADE